MDGMGYATPWLQEFKKSPNFRNSFSPSGRFWNGTETFSSMGLSCFSIPVFGCLWSNYSDLTRPGPPKGSLVREIPLFQENPGW